MAAGVLSLAGGTADGRSLQFVRAECPTVVATTRLHLRDIATRTWADALVNPENSSCSSELRSTQPRAGSGAQTRGSSRSRGASRTAFRCLGASSKSNPNLLEQRLIEHPPTLVSRRHERERRITVHGNPGDDWSRS